MSEARIDRGRVRAALRRLAEVDRRILLEHALDLLPDEELRSLVCGYVDPDDLRATTESAGFLAEVEEFRRASLAGEFFGTSRRERRTFPPLVPNAQIWIAECHRLLRECVAAAEQGRDRDARMGFDIVFELLRTIDECQIEIVDLGDEHSSFEVWVHWREILPAYFGCLARTAGPAEFATAALEAIRAFGGADRGRFLEGAVAVADAGQRLAIQTSSAIG